MRHLYIFEDGTAAVHQDPTPEDYKMADDGTLAIFRFVPGSLRGEIQEYVPDSAYPTKFEPVERGCLESDGNGGLYHTPARTEPDES
jgi:hypothetical protein